MEPHRVEGLKVDDKIAINLNGIFQVMEVGELYIKVWDKNGAVLVLPLSIPFSTYKVG